MQTPYAIDAMIRYSDASPVRGRMPENRIAEPVAIESYRAFVEMIRYDDPTTRRIMERIMKMDEKHAGLLRYS